MPSLKVFLTTDQLFPQPFHLQFILSVPSTGQNSSVGDAGTTKQSKNPFASFLGGELARSQLLQTTTHAIPAHFPKSLKNIENPGETTPSITQWQVSLLASAASNTPFPALLPPGPAPALAIN